MSLLDLFFPKFCVNCHKFGSYLCPKCFSYVSFVETGFCTVCQKAAIGGVTHPGCRTKYGIDGVFASLVYKGVVKKLVYVFKYRPYLTNLQALLTDFFYEGLIQNEFFYRLLGKDACLIPIPLHPAKLRKRGYNQATLLAEGLGKKFGIPVVDCLERVKNTKTQVGLTQKERQENSRDAFTVKTSFVTVLHHYPKAFLVDDVVTSGATLKEAASVVKRAGVHEVWGVTLAHGL